MRKLRAVICLLLVSFFTRGQSINADQGVVAGNLLDEKKNAISGASVEILLLKDSGYRKGTISDKDGGFQFSQLPMGIYRLKISSVGYKTSVIDSISIRPERFDFSLNDIVLKNSGDQLAEVVVYAEKPLIQSKEGNITFNAGESPLSAGSNASDLLKNVPLVTNDPNGKITVRGREPKILIDDKPVELNAQQLQDFLESMPGSMIERIEVMTNPPPQYANEPGGVINIVTKKGKVGKTGRISTYAGTRGEYGMNGNFNLRKKGFSLNINVGRGYNIFEGNGYSKRKNIYADSVNYFNTTSQYHNENQRPNARINLDYDINERNSINATLNYNQNNFDNNSEASFINLDQHQQVYRLSQRNIRSEGTSKNPSMSLTYTYKGKKPGETFRFFSNSYFSDNQNDRYFFQQYLNPDYTPNGNDSTQQQFNNSRNRGYNLRLAYDKLFDNKTTSVSAGAYLNRNTSDVELLSEYLKKPENLFLKSDLLSNDFRFIQVIRNMRVSGRQMLSKSSSISTGFNLEETAVRFDLYQQKQESRNSYWTFLPFFNFNKQW